MQSIVSRAPGSRLQPLSGLHVRILDPLEIEAPRRRRRPALEARPALEQVRDPLRADLQHRADERAHHVPEERVGGDGEVEVVAVALPRRLADDPHEHLVLALGRA